MDLVADVKAQDSSRLTLAMDGHTETSGPVASALCSVAGMTTPSIFQLQLGCCKNDD